MKDYCSPEQDAHYLQKAQEIMSDKKRHSSAKKHLGKLSQERSKEAAHANAARGLRAAFPDANPDQQNSKASAAASSQAAKVRGKKGSSDSTVTKISAVPSLKGTSVGGY